MRPDVAIVGGGIAGCALATTLARGGLDVVVLERREEYDDQVRGENLHPWGVAEAQRLDLYDALAGSGGHVVEEVVSYDGDTDPRVAEELAIPLSALVDGVPGELNLGHPDACEALAATAVAAGATVLRGVSHVDVDPGPRPTLHYRHDGAAHETACRLVVGADGRSSRTRRQVGITLERAPGVHMVAGLLVDGLEVDDRRNVVGIGADVWMVTFPQGGGRARVYLCPGTENPQRFAGPGATDRFLNAAALDAVPNGQAWREAVPAGPCRTFPADDTWTDQPFAEGVVLIGDAAGYNDPLIGQGLAMALRDTRVLSELLLQNRNWGAHTFSHYASERTERLRRVRFLAQLQATVWTTFGPDGRRIRRHVRRQQRHDPSLLAVPLAIFTGPDSLDPAVCTDAFGRHYLGLDLWRRNGDGTEMDTHAGESSDSPAQHTGRTEDGVLSI